MQGRSQREAEADWGRQIDELVSDSGVVMGHACPRDSALLRVAEDEDDWSLVASEIGESRVTDLESGALSTDDERKRLRRARLVAAFECPDDDVTPGIFFCKAPKADAERPCVVVVCWGSGWETRRELFGEFKTAEEAYAALTAAFHVSFGENSVFRLATMEPVPLDIQSYIGSDIAQMGGGEKPPKSVLVVAKVDMGSGPGGGAYRTYLLQRDRWRKRWTLWEKGSDYDTGKPLYCRVAYGESTSAAKPEHAARLLLERVWLDEIREGFLPGSIAVEETGLLSRDDIKEMERLLIEA